MTISEFAEASGISRGLAYSLAKQDALGVRVIKLGRRLVLSRAKAKALLSGHGKGQDASHT